MMKQKKISVNLLRVLFIALSVMVIAVIMLYTQRKIAQNIDSTEITAVAVNPGRNSVNTSNNQTNVVSNGTNTGGTGGNGTTTPPTTPPKWPTDEDLQKCAKSQIPYLRVPNGKGGVITIDCSEKSDVRILKALVWLLEEKLLNDENTCTDLDPSYAAFTIDSCFKIDDIFSRITLRFDLNWDGKISKTELGEMLQHFNVDWLERQIAYKFLADLLKGGITREEFESSLASFGITVYKGVSN